MALRRNQGPFAPNRQPQGTINWEAEFAARDALRAQEAKVAEQARQWAREFLGDADPLNQIIKQLRGLDARCDGFDRRLGVADEQFRTAIEMVVELSQRVDELTAEVRRLKSPVGRLRRRKIEVNGEEADDGGR